jgi:hypothetical protein
MRDNRRKGTDGRTGCDSKCERNQQGRMHRWTDLRHHASDADGLRGNAMREEDLWGRETRDGDEMVKEGEIPRRCGLSNT